MQPSSRTLPRKRAPASVRARLAQVSLDRIRVPVEMLGLLERLKPLPPLHVSKEASDAVSLFRPPLLMEDDLNEGGYVLLANARTVQWLQGQADLDPSFSRTVSCVVLAGDPNLVERLRDIEAYLVPMVLGEASVRKTLEARRRLKDAGVARPRRMSDRHRLQQALARRGAD